MKNLHLFFAFVLFAQIIFITAGYSQITITSSDFQNRLNVSINTLSYGSSDTLGLKSVISASGANKTWDVTARTFTGGAITSTSTLLNKSTSGAPLQSNSTYSSATMVNQTRSSNNPLFTGWSYISLTTTGYYYYGYVQDSAGIVKSHQENSPAWLEQKFPTTYLTSWSWSSTVTSYSGNVGVGIGMEGVDVIDAWGTIITPEGTFPCLRHKNIIILDFGFFTSASCTYEFFDQNRTYASINTTDEAGNIPSSVTYYTQTTGTGISESPNFVPSGFQLSQNYPNPFNPNTKINFSIPKTSFVTLRVYNLLGKEILTLVNEEKSIGNYEVEFYGNDLPSGIYFYRMQAGGFTDTKKFILLR